MEFLSTVRIGQISGSTANTWPYLVDGQGWPLLNDIGRWGAVGFDEGANTEYENRLYIFSGDVTPNSRDDRTPLNSDLVAWTDETRILRHGGHLSIGWLNFILPSSETGGGAGQPDWRFCGKCSGLFWDGDQNFKGVCPQGETHSAAGWNFILPSIETGGGQGQSEWRFRGKCGGLFWDGDPNFKGVCPKGDTHSAPSGSWNFIVPSIETGGGQGQSEWRFCGKCGGLFWDGDPNSKGVCPKGDTHSAPSGSWNFIVPSIETGGGVHSPTGLHFILPSEETGGGQGQPDWRFCGKCGGLFWNGDPNFKGACPKGEVHSALGWNFILPSVETGGGEGQPDWRFCGKCGALFWDGDSSKGVCPGAPGGGFHLHSVQSDGAYWPFQADPPIRLTLSNETPSAAFSYGGRVYVFAGISETFWSGTTRPGDPAYGLYLVSSDRPDQPQSFRKEFLFNPRLGVCPSDGESHDVLGFNFVLPHDITAGPSHQPNWFRCRKCAWLFRSLILSTTRY